MRAIITAGAKREKGTSIPGTNLLTVVGCGSTLPLPRVESAVPSKTAFDETLLGSGHKSQDHVGRVFPEESPGAGAQLRST